MQKKERRLLLIFLVGIMLAGGVYLYGGRPGMQQASAQVSEQQGNSSVTQQAQETAAANTQQIKVNVRGEVNHPGVYRLPSDSRVIDAIEAAGGAKDDGNVEQMNLASALADGADVTVPSKNAGQAQDGSTNGATADSKVNLNTATAADLDKLPGIGSIRANAIVSYRNDNGPFTQVDDLKNVPGFGDKLVEEIRSYVTVQ